MENRKSLVVSILVVLLATSSLAAFNANKIKIAKPTSQKNYSDLKKFPIEVIQPLSSADYYEQYMYNVVELFRNMTGGESELTKRTIELNKQKAIASQRAQQVQNVLIYDLNGDGNVTKEEVDTFDHKLTQGRHRAYISNPDTTILHLDSNADGVIELPEMQAINLEEQGLLEQFKSQETLLSFAAKDGKITLDQIKKMAEEAFSIADQNADGILSPEERALVTTTTSQSEPIPIQKIDLDPNSELHVVGVYEGNEKTNDEIHGPVVNIEVDRPGKKVTLLLVSSNSTAWHVKTNSDTTITKVIVSDQNSRSAVLLNDKPRNADETLSDPLYVYQKEGEPFRKLLDFISQSMSRKEIASFHGDYTASESAYKISEVVKDDELKKAHLAGKVADPASLPKITYNAILNGVAGEYDLSGTLIRRIPEELVGAAFVPSEKAYYAINEDNGFKKYDQDGALLEEIHVSLDVPTISWPTGVAYNPKSNQVVMVTLGGEGYLYAYNLDTKKWSVISSMKDIDVQSVAYDPLTENYISSMNQHDPEQLVISIFDSKGNASEPITIPYSDLIGVLDFSDIGNSSVPYIDILPSEKYFVLKAGSSTLQAGTLKRIYLYDRESKKAQLTWMEPLEN